MSNPLTLSDPNVALDFPDGKASICIYLDTDQDLYSAIKFPNIRYLAEDAANYREQSNLEIENMLFYVQDAFRISIPIDLVFLNPTV